MSAGDGKDSQRVHKPFGSVICLDLRIEGGSSIIPIDKLMLNVACDSNNWKSGGSMEDAVSMLRNRSCPMWAAPQILGKIENYVGMRLSVCVTRGDRGKWTTPSYRTEEIVGCIIG